MNWEILHRPYLRISTMGTVQENQHHGDGKKNQHPGDSPRKSASWGRSKKISTVETTVQLEENQHHGNGPRKSAPWRHPTDDIIAPAKCSKGEMYNICHIWGRYIKQVHGALLEKYQMALSCWNYGTPTVPTMLALSCKNWGNPTSKCEWNEA